MAATHFFALGLLLVAGLAFVPAASAQSSCIIIALDPSHPIWMDPQGCGPEIEYFIHFLTAPAKPLVDCLYKALFTSTVCEW